MDQAVVKLEDDLDKADEAYQNTYRQARETLNEVAGAHGRWGTEYTMASDVYSRDISAAYTALNEAKTAAWRALGESTEDPQVKYIAENCQEYPDESMIALRAVPLTMRSARALQQEHGWCSTFTSFLNKAGELGIIDDPRTPARRALEEHVAHNFGIGSISQRVYELVDEIVKAEAALYASDPDAWQAQRDREKV